jgi:hypothetical protein
VALDRTNGKRLMNAREIIAHSSEITKRLLQLHNHST